MIIIDIWNENFKLLISGLPEFQGFLLFLLFATHEAVQFCTEDRIQDLSVDGPFRDIQAVKRLPIDCEPHMSQMEIIRSTLLSDHLVPARNHEKQHGLQRDDMNMMIQIRRRCDRAVDYVLFNPVHGG